MASVWFTADLHLGQGSIIKFWRQTFFSAEERELARQGPCSQWRTSEETVRRHDEALLDAINSQVGVNDTLWILGDFCQGKLSEATPYRDRIQCRHVHLAWGNHDHRTIRPLFDGAIDQGMIQVEGQEIWLNHYPMRSWNRSFYGSWHLYGHVHGRLSAADALNDWMLTRDVGVDACGYRPWGFEELRDYMAPRIARFRERRGAVLRGEADIPLA